MTMTKENLDVQIAQLLKGTFSQGELNARMMETLTDVNILSDYGAYEDEEVMEITKALVKEWSILLEEGWY